MGPAYRREHDVRSPTAGGTFGGEDDHILKVFSISTDDLGDEYPNERKDRPTSARAQKATW
jgi:hypothetical protein